MDSNLSNKFVNLLISKTLERSLTWLPLTEQTAIDGEPASDILGQDEWHHIYYFESYYLHFGTGKIFLMSEFNESARDEKYNTEGYFLYIQTEKNTPLIPVMFDTAELYRLRNAIQATVEIPSAAIHFIEEFIAQTE